MITHLEHHRFLHTVCLIIAASTLCFVIASSTVRATLNETLYPLGLGFFDSAPEVSEQFTEIPLVAMSEAQHQVPFPISLPTRLPQGTTLRGVHVRGNWVNVSYVSHLNSNASGMGIEMAQGASFGSYIVPDSAKQSTTVGGHSATYVHGAWDQHMQWNDLADSGSLTWEAHGLSYKLTFSGLGLNHEDVVHVAESIQ